jgi:hypothetical protein
VLGGGGAVVVVVEVVLAVVVVVGSWIGSTATTVSVAWRATTSVVAVARATATAINASTTGRRAMTTSLRRGHGRWMRIR